MGEVLLKAVEVELQVLNESVAELDVGVANLAAGDLVAVLAGEGEHLAVAVDADDAAGWPDRLRQDVTEFAAARAEVDDGFTHVHEPGGIAAAVVALDDFLRDDCETIGLVLDGTAERLFAGIGRGGVALVDGAFGCRRHRFPLVGLFDSSRIGMHIAMREIIRR